MPNIKSAKKRLRQNIKKYAINSSRKAEVRTSMKLVRSLAEEGKLEEAKKEYTSRTISLLDKALKSKLYHKNTVNRYKSRLAKLVNSK